MLTRCPACATHFRVTTEQLKARSGRVRCGECRHVFNALDSLIEEPTGLVAARKPEAPRPEIPPLPVIETETPAPTAAPVDEVVPLPTPAVEPVEDEVEELLAWEPEPSATWIRESLAAAEPGAGEPAAEELAAAEPLVAEPPPFAPEAAAPDLAELQELPATQAETAAKTVAETAEAPAKDSNQTFPALPPAPRRWPWAIGIAFGLLILAFQVALAFRVELSVLWPEARPRLIAICEVFGCEVGLPAKVALVGIEASDLHPDNQHPGRLGLTATLKNRAPFPQQFPHLELTLTDIADKAIARKVLAPTDYLPPPTPLAEGMPPNADIVVAVGIDPGELTASGYRLYLFYP